MNLIPKEDVERLRACFVTALLLCTFVAGLILGAGIASVFLKVMGR
jgi:hypothetical protein